MKVISMLVITAYLVLSCTSNHSTIPYFNSADFEPVWIGEEMSAQSKLHTIADFSFVNQNNDVITHTTYQDKIYVTDFFFTTCPSICPKMTRSMSKLQDEYKEESRVMLLSHTVTPWIDSVAQLKRYAVANEVDDTKWHLVTGTQEALYNQARTSYFAEKEIGLQLSSDDFLHTENFILVDQDRHIRGIYNGTIDNDIQRLIEDINILLSEAK